MFSKLFFCLFFIMSIFMANAFGAGTMKIYVLKDKCSFQNIEIGDNDSSLTVRKVKQASTLVGHATKVERDDNSAVIFYRNMIPSDVDSQGYPLKKSKRFNSYNGELDAAMRNISYDIIDSSKGLLVSAENCSNKEWTIFNTSKHRESFEDNSKPVVSISDYDTYTFEFNTFWAATCFGVSKIWNYRHKWNSGQVIDRWYRLIQSWKFSNLRNAMVWNTNDNKKNKVVGTAGHWKDDDWVQSLTEMASCIYRSKGFIGDSLGKTDELNAISGGAKSLLGNAQSRANSYYGCSKEIGSKFSSNYEYCVRDFRSIQPGWDCSRPAYGTRHAFYSTPATDPGCF